MALYSRCLRQAAERALAQPPSSCQRRFWANHSLSLSSASSSSSASWWSRQSFSTKAAKSSSSSTSSPQETETFLNGTSSLYAEQMYDQYLEHPDSVHPSWKLYFENMEKGVSFKADDYNRPSTIPGRKQIAVVRT